MNKPFRTDIWIAIENELFQFRHIISYAQFPQPLIRNRIISQI